MNPGDSVAENEYQSFLRCYQKSNYAKLSFLVTSYTQTTPREFWENLQNHFQRAKQGKLEGNASNKIPTTLDRSPGTHWYLIGSDYDLH